MTMNVLPEVSEKQAIKYDYFPTAWQAVVWRNWGYLPVERIANALQTTVSNIKEAAEMLGLNPEEPVDSVWEKRGYLTLIRDNWHLCTYEQILTLLNLSEETLAFILKEDDFMWVKLGNMKPAVIAPQYAPLTEEQKQQTKQIAEMLKQQLRHENGAEEKAFTFVEGYHEAVSEQEYSLVTINETENLRMVYPYFALYGDVLIDESIDPLPERILKEYAQAGINGIWMQMVLYQMVEFPFEPELSKGWEKRIASLKKLVAKAKKYGIGIYPYFNEPRAMSDAFFQKYPHLRGQSEGDFYAMCTSTPEVQEYLYNSVKKLFEMIPDLPGYFTITMSENLTNCYSRLVGEMTCPRCKERMPWEVVAEVNNLMAKGAHDAVPSAKAISWTWGWSDDWAEKVVPLLTEGQIVQCTSEEALPFCIGGVKGNVLDYTMSLCGPSEKSRRVWKTARECGLQVSAKVQINNTWEMAVVPYIPVFARIAEHICNLKEQGVQHLHAGWTLGGCPSPNLRLAAWLMEDKGTVKEFLVDWLGEELGQAVDKAQKVLSDAFSHYPFHIDTLYYGPQNFGIMAPFFLQKTNYQATMVGFPYDDLRKWAGIYPTEVYESEYQKLCEGWEKGVAFLEGYEGLNSELDELILIAKAILCQYESAYHHIQFVRYRGDDATEVDALGKKEMIRVIHEEMDTVKRLIQYQLKDSRIGYESSNHYFYTMQDLKEKIINLDWCEKNI